MSTIVRQPCDEGVIRTAPDHAPCPKGTGSWVLAATILGSGMVFIDGTVVNVALPVIQNDLGARVTEVQWIVEAYALFLASLILVGGSLGDRFGRRRIFAAGIVVFAAASVGCGLAPGSKTLIVARAAQGIGGALLVPGSLAIISASFGSEQRGRAIGTWSGGSAITAALGPVLGGWLVDNLSWRWVFFINVPLATAVLVILFRYVPESRDESAATVLDWRGAVLATVGLGSLVWGLIESAWLGTGHPAVVITVGGGAVALIGFVVAEARCPAPMMPLDLFRSRGFSGANLVTLLLYAGLGGALFFLPFNLVQVQGYSPTQAGAALLPLVLLIFFLSRWSGGVASRIGFKVPLVVGPTVAAVGFALFAVPGVGGSYWTTFFPAVVVLGVGMAISIAPLTTAVMSSVDVRRAGVASGINNAVSRVAGLIAVAAMGLLIVGPFNRGLDRRLAAATIEPAIVRELDDQRAKLAAACIPSSADVDTAAVIRRAVLESYVDGFRVLMLVAAGLSLLGALTAVVTIRGREST